MALEKNLFVENLAPGQEVSLPLLVKVCSRQISSRGVPYLNLVLTDRTGSLFAKVWDSADQLKVRLAAGTVAQVQGQVQLYQGQLQMIVRWAEPVDWAEVSADDYVICSRRSLESLTLELDGILAGMTDPDYKLITQKALRHPKTGMFWSGPAAKAFHHAYQRGLLEHTVSVAKMAEMVAGHYGPVLDSSLLVSGAILHDIGKVWEFSQGPAADYTTPGRLLGHLYLGAEFLKEVASELTDFPAEKLLLLQHLLVSHHGEPNLGSPQKPKILEAIALHQLDDLDGKLNGIGAFIRQEQELNENPASPGQGPRETGQWTSYNKLLGEYFYKTPGTEKWGGDWNESQITAGPENKAPQSEVKSPADKTDPAGEFRFTDKGEFLF
ncbi:MAG: HD domain-containing protein [Deltaproteobacteria bacterium]|nr:HD domain-containing protein [Deltaproteobacteria bacterium]